MALDALACSKPQSFSGLREGTKLQMRCSSGLTCGVVTMSILRFSNVSCWHVFVKSESEVDNLGGPLV